MFKILYLLGSFVFVVTIGLIFGELCFRISKLIKKLKTHCYRWNKWRKNSLESKFCKFLVLIGLSRKQNLDWILTDKEISKMPNYKEVGDDVNM